MSHSPALPTPRRERTAHRAAGEPRTDPRPKSAPPGRRAAAAWSDAAPTLAPMSPARERLLADLDALLCTPVAPLAGSR